MPTLVAAAGGHADLPARLREGYMGKRVHLDSYNQLSFLTGETDSNRSEIFYYSGTRLQAVRYRDWKAHFAVQNHGWSGPVEELNAPLLFNLRRDPCEKAAEESGMYTHWMGKKMWAFGPAKNLVVQHMQTLQAFPPRGAPANNAHAEQQAREDNGLAQ